MNHIFTQIKFSLPMLLMFMFYLGGCQTYSDLRYPYDVDRIRYDQIVVQPHTLSQDAEYPLQGYRHSKSYHAGQPNYCSEFLKSWYTNKSIDNAQRLKEMRYIVKRIAPLSFYRAAKLAQDSGHKYFRVVQFSTDIDIDPSRLYLPSKDKFSMLQLSPGNQLRLSRTGTLHHRSFVCVRVYKTHKEAKDDILRDQKRNPKIFNNSKSYLYTTSKQLKVLKNYLKKKKII